VEFGRWRGVESVTRRRVIWRGGARGWGHWNIELCRCDNCHSHVAMAMNEVEYGGITSWNMVYLAAWMFFAGRYVSFTSFLLHWVPFVVIVLLFSASTLLSPSSSPRK